MNTNTNTSEKPRSRGKKIALIVFLALFVTCGLPTGIRVFVLEAFKIPAGSMIPTLEIGDHLFASKLGYEPRRGDVAIFIYPQDESKDFVKRIVALGGDTIEVRDNVIFLNGKPIKRRKLSGPCSYQDIDYETGEAVPRPCVAFEEELDGTRYRVYQDRDSFTPSFPPRKIPPGHAFVMGDNRDNSHDSRFWGTVPLENFKGRASIIWWSYSPAEGIRWDRIGKKVHDPPDTGSGS